MKKFGKVLLHSLKGVIICLLLVGFIFSATGCNVMLSGLVDPMAGMADAVNDANAKVDQANIRMLQTAAIMYLSSVDKVPKAGTILTSKQLGAWLAEGTIPLRKSDGKPFVIKVNASRTGVDVT